MSEDTPFYSSVKMKMIFRILEDQKDHSMREIAALLNLPAEQVVAFLKFLATYRIVNCEEKADKVIINEDFVTLS